MLVLSRQVGQGISLGDFLTLHVAAISNDHADLQCSFTTLPRFLIPEWRIIPLDQEIVSRRKDEGLRIGNDIEIHVIRIEIASDATTRIRLGVQAPPEVSVHRLEIDIS